MTWTSRKDGVTSAVIDRAVEILTADGEYFAASYLQHHGMSLSSIVRIMGGRRRSAPVVIGRTVTHIPFESDVGASI